jgi:plasmid stabilization system protein ParE
MPIKYRLRQAARDDLKDIARYTLKHRGKVQRDKYLNGFKERFELLGENPNSVVLVMTLRSAITVATTTSMWCSMLSKIIM